MEVNTSGETMQSRNNSSRRWAHAGVIFSPPWHGMPIGDARWKRLIQQCVTGCNWGQKRRDSRFNKKLVPDPEEQHILLVMHALRQQRYSYERIAHKLAQSN